MGRTLVRTMSYVSALRQYIYIMIIPPISRWEPASGWAYCIILHITYMCYVMVRL